MARMRLGVVGIDHFHTTGWVDSLEHYADTIEIVALYDADAEMGRTLRPRFADPGLTRALDPKFKALPFYTDLDRMIAEQRLDLALVTLQPRDAPDGIVKLAAAGISMLADKPVTRNAADCRRAADAVRKSGARCMVGLTNRLVGGWPDMRRMVQAGRIGRLLSAEALFTTSSVAVRDPANHLFSADRHGHGVLHWLGCHWVDALLWVSGEPIVEVQAMSANVLGEKIGVEDAISVAFRYAGGGLGTMHFVNAFPRPNSDGYLAFRGVDGSLKVDSGGTLTFVGPGSRANPLLAEEHTYQFTDPGGYGPSALVAIDNLLTAVRSGTQTPVTLDDMARALDVIDAAYESAAAGGRRVAVPQHEQR
jgi:predicted dehydrogenase